MRGKEAIEHLNRTLSSHLCTIHETFQMLDQPTAPSSEKVSWEEVVKMSYQISKQAAFVGMLWNGERPDARAIEDIMASFFNDLRGFILLCHGTTVGAGPTLSSRIRASVKRVLDPSTALMEESVSLYGDIHRDKEISIPYMIGSVWEACSALKKTPGTNIVAIGRGMTQVAVSMKDVLREMKELKPASSDPKDPVDETCAEPECEPHDKDLSDGELRNDLSPEEMKVAQLTITVVSDTLNVIKELIHSVTALPLLKLEKANDNSSFVDSLEKLLKLCQEIGLEIDNIRVCIYHPQVVRVIKVAIEKIHGIIDDVQAEAEGFKGASEVFPESCNVLRNSLKLLVSELSDPSTADLEAKVESITLSS